MSLNLSIKKHQRQAAHPYNWKWKTSPQPLGRVTLEDYHNMSLPAAPEFERQVEDVLEENNFSYIKITHDDFQEYERNDKNFREWLEDYCVVNNISSRVDFVLMGTRIKSLESCRRKEATGERFSEEIGDYIGIELIALKQSPQNPKNKQSLINLERLISAIENDEGTIAIKDYLRVPHKKTKFRGHKSKRDVTIPKGTVWEDLIMRGELKVQHENQMDVDKLTRPFINLDRDTTRLNAQFKGLVSQKNSRVDFKRANKQCTKAQEREKAMTALGGLLYDRVHYDSGLNYFLDSEIADNFSALPLKALHAAAEETIKEHFTNGRKKEMLDLISRMDMFQKLGSKKSPTRTRKSSSSQQGLPQRRVA